jgi:hypothetical protein
MGSETTISGGKNYQIWRHLSSTTLNYRDKCHWFWVDFTTFFENICTQGSLKSGYEFQEFLPFYPVVGIPYYLYYYISIVLIGSICQDPDCYEVSAGFTRLDY